MKQKLKIIEVIEERAKAKRIVLIIGEKNAGKSTYILQMYEDLKKTCTLVERKNADNPNTIIYVLKNNITQEIIILNSGSDSMNIIDTFGNILTKYTQIGTIYTAIRPKKVNPRLHDRMMNVLGIK